MQEARRGPGTTPLATAPGRTLVHVPKASVGRGRRETIYIYIYIYIYMGGTILLRVVVQWFKKIFKVIKHVLRRVFESPQ